MWVYKNKMATNIVFVHEATIDKVYGGENSDGDRSVSEAEIEEGEDDASEDVDEEENEEENWVVGSRKPTILDFTADRGLNVDLPENPSFIPRKPF